MSYDTTVNDALDPPAARIAAHGRSAARWWTWLGALTLIAVILGSALAWNWLR